MALPHIQNSEAGRNLYDPYHNSIFYVYFTLPEALRDEFGQDEALISEHVKTVSGLDALDKGPDTGKQTFMGRVDFFHLSIAILYSYLFIWFIVVSEKINEKE